MLSLTKHDLVDVLLEEHEDAMGRRFPADVKTTVDGGKTACKLSLGAGSRKLDI